MNCGEKPGSGCETGPLQHWGCSAWAQLPAATSRARHPPGAGLGGEEMGSGSSPSSPTGPCPRSLLQNLGSSRSPPLLAPGPQPFAVCLVRGAWLSPKCARRRRGHGCPQLPWRFFLLPMPRGRQRRGSRGSCCPSPVPSPGCGCAGRRFWVLDTQPMWVAANWTRVLLQASLEPNTTMWG